MATGYATLYGDMAGGFAVIKDVPKTLVYALCNDLNERCGREVIPRTVIEKPPSAELAPGQLDSDSLPPYDVLDPIVEGYVEDDLSVQRADRARSRRRSHAARRAHGRSQRVQAPAGRARSARVAEGVRQGSPAPDHQSLARLTVEPDAVSGSVPLTWETARPLVPELALIAATIAYGATFKLVQNALDGRDAGRIHPAAVLDGRDRAAAARDPQRLARSVDRARLDCGARDFFARGARVRRGRVRGLLVPERGPRTHDDVELRVHHRAVRRVHAAVRDGGDAPPPVAQRHARGRRSRSSACSCSKARRCACTPATRSRSRARSSSGCGS